MQIIKISINLSLHKVSILAFIFLIGKLLIESTTWNQSVSQLKPTWAFKKPLVLLNYQITFIQYEKYLNNVILTIKILQSELLKTENKSIT